MSTFSSEIILSKESNGNTYEIITVLSIAIIFSILLNFIAFLLPNNPVDFILQVSAGVDISQGKMLYRDIGKLNINGTTLPRPQYPPLYLYTLGALFKFFGIKELNLAALQITKIFLSTFLVLDGILLYNLLRNRLNFQYSLLVMISFMIHPAVIANLVGFHENYLIFFLLLGIIWYDRRHYFWCGFVLGLALLVKPVAIILVWVLLMTTLFRRTEGWINQFFQSMQIVGTSLMVFFLGLVYFLIHAPQQVISDIILIHLSRSDPNMSIYFYFGQFLDKSGMLLILQLTAQISLVYFYFRLSQQKNDPLFFLSYFYLSSLLVFYLFNRILYPHYLEQLVPWFIICLIWTLWKIKIKEVSLSIKKHILPWILAHVLFLVSAGLWGIIWMLDATKNTMDDNILYPIASITFSISLIATLFITLTLFKAVTETNLIKSENTL